VDLTNYKRCFVATDYRNREMLLLRARAGPRPASLALVWNWAEDTLHPYDLGGG